MTEFRVRNMSCGHCVKAVTAAVHGVDPAAEVRVDIAAGKVAVESGRPAARIAEAILAAGYPVEPA